MSYGQLDRVLRDIQTFKYQGATEVARATLNAYCDFGVRLQLRRTTNWLSQMKAARNYLWRNNRPTEPLAQNGLRFVWDRVRRQPTKFILKRSTAEFLLLLVQTQERISLLGRALIQTGDKVYTHCHSSTVEQLLVKTHEKKKFHVFASETRPLYQGHITAKKLQAKRIPVTIVVDGAGPFLVSEASGKELMMDSVVIGADVISADGSIINKIGSYGLTLAASEQGVPVYIVCSLLKYSRSAATPIERRSAKEVWADAPVGVNIINFAFDRVPAKNITRLVTEFGLIEPSRVRAYVNKHYPWLLK
ncbi:MAG: translation initiation factor eIF-2B [Patescibacteria group bacterium]